jgi:hypothetical protein
VADQKGSGICSHCHGSGQQLGDAHEIIGDQELVPSENGPCTFCLGTGTCQTCNGTGEA